MYAQGLYFKDKKAMFATNILTQQSFYCYFFLKKNILEENKLWLSSGSNWNIYNILVHMGVFFLSQMVVIGSKTYVPPYWLLPVGLETQIQSSLEVHQKKFSCGKRLSHTFNNLDPV